MFLRAVATAALVVSAGMAAPAVAAPAVTCKPANAQVRTPVQYKAPKLTLKARTYTMRIVTNCGTVTIAADAKRAPKTVAALTFLARNKYFNNTACHRLTTQGINILQCGDPTATGTGGPGFTYPDENLPTKVTRNRYPAGTVAMANAGPGTNGSQFFLVYATGTFDLPPNYTVWGRITSGLPILAHIAAQGVADGGADGPPAQAVVVKSITVSEGTP